MFACKRGEAILIIDLDDQINYSNWLQFVFRK